MPASIRNHLTIQTAGFLAVTGIANAHLFKHTERHDFRLTPDLGVTTVEKVIVELHLQGSQPLMRGVGFNHASSWNLVHIAYHDDIVTFEVGQPAHDRFILMPNPRPGVIVLVSGNREVAKIVHDVRDLVKEPLVTFLVQIKIERLGFSLVGLGSLDNDKAINHIVKFIEPDIQKLKLTEKDAAVINLRLRLFDRSVCIKDVGVVGVSYVAPERLKNSLRDAWGMCGHIIMTGNNAPVL